MANAAEASSSALGRLDEASQQHEVNLVIDLGMDRLLKWIGVYLILALAALAKIGDFVGANLSCYPTNESTSVGGEFISFTTTYCWEASHNVVTTDACERANISSAFALLDTPNDIKFFMQWLPYFMLAQAFMIAIPWAFWHFRVGARLLGHLKFMQLLLGDIFAQVQQIPEALYDDEPYDETSKYFDGRRLYKPKQPPIQLDNVNVPSQKTGQQDKLLSNQGSIPLQNVQQQASGAMPSVSVNGGSYNKTKMEALCSLEWLLVGDMKDRHFFSMLCYENFASMHHLPYILSVFKLCELIKPNKNQDPEEDYYQLNESMLYQWCHRKNFNNTFLVKTYFYKHIITSILTLIMLGIMLWFAVAISDQILSSETFRCPLPYQEICLLCTIKRKRDVFAIFCVDFVLTLLIFLMSLGNWLVVRKSSKRATCHFFDDMKETCNVALLAARLAKK